MVKDKVIERLLMNIRRNCEIQLVNGEVIEGSLDGFRARAEALILSINVPSCNGVKPLLVNFRYVSTIRFKTQTTKTDS